MLLFRPVLGAQTVTVTTETFASAKKTIHVERFAPAADPARHPAVVLLYGSRGLTADGEAFRSYARGLAEHGYVAYLPHYFDATGSETAGTLPVPPERFRIWTRAVEDAISYAARDSRVDARRIGLLGMSLGGFLAAWEASQDARVQALAEYYGGASMFLAPPKRMPATLIIHGEKDSFVPVEQARQLQRLVEEQHAPCEIGIYPGQGHGFNFDGDPAAAHDAWDRTLSFFQRRLRERVPQS